MRCEPSKNLESQGGALMVQLLPSIIAKYVVLTMNISTDPHFQLMSSCSFSTNCTVCSKTCNHCNCVCATSDNWGLTNRFNIISYIASLRLKAWYIGSPTTISKCQAPSHAIQNGCTNFLILWNNSAAGRKSSVMPIDPKAASTGFFCGLLHCQ